MKKIIFSQALYATISCKGMVLVSRKLDFFKTFGVFLQPRCTIRVAFNDEIKEKDEI